MKVLCFFNSFFGVAGGEIRFVEIFKRANNFNKVVITPALGETFCKSKGLSASYIQTTKESRLSNVMFTYAFRIIKVFLLKLSISNNDIIYSTSDFLPDVLPAFFYKLRNKNVQWVADIFHIIPPPIQRSGPFIKNLVSFSMQRISLQFIRMRSDLVFVLNKGIVKQLVKLGFPENRIHVTGAGINFAKISRIHSRGDCLYDACFLGRLHPSKGIFDLLEFW
jgi:glycosyltransferase involved in cell wall biosynthesis